MANRKRTGRLMGKLNDLQVKRASKRGLLNDGNGLNLQIAANGSKSWVLRYKLNGKARSLGLGPLRDVSLGLARERAADARREIFNGVDVVEARRERKVASRLDVAKSNSFDEVAEEFITSHRDGWRNKKHAEQWRSTLRTYASPVFGKLPVAAVDVRLVLKTLQPIWAVKPETASRLRGRIEAVLGYAKALKHREGENPAQWRGNLDALLPARSKVRRVKHHSALAYTEVGAFMVDLRRRDAVAASALDFAILSACRTSEVLNATWEEIDLTNRVWTVPESRMKAGREHKVPLSDAGMAVLEAMKVVRRSNYIFPGMKRSKPLSNMAMLNLLNRMGRGDLTVHGFRSSFRDWCAEQTNFPSEVAEMALAHAVGNKVEAAYRRGDLFEKRRKLMDAWATYISKPTADYASKVVAIRSGS
jgi:integrase